MTNMSRIVNLPPIAYDQIVNFANSLAPLANEAPFINLLPGQKKALGGSLFPHCEHVVREVSYAIM